MWTNMPKIQEKDGLMVEKQVRLPLLDRFIDYAKFQEFVSQEFQLSERNLKIKLLEFEYEDGPQADLDRKKVSVHWEDLARYEMEGFVIRFFLTSTPVKQIDRDMEPEETYIPPLLAGMYEHGSDGLVHTKATELFDTKTVPAKRKAVEDEEGTAMLEPKKPKTDAEVSSPDGDTTLGVDGCTRPESSAHPEGNTHAEDNTHPEGSTHAEDGFADGEGGEDDDEDGKKESLQSDEEYYTPEFEESHFVNDGRLQKADLIMDDSYEESEISFGDTVPSDSKPDSDMGSLASDDGRDVDLSTDAYQDLDAETENSGDDRLSDGLDDTRVPSDHQLSDIEDEDYVNTVSDEGSPDQEQTVFQQEEGWKE